MPLTPKLDRYRYLDELGRGGMSRVVLAEDVLLGRRVALKHMYGGDDSGSLLRLRREALIGASVSHPNLVSIYDIVAAEGGEYVIVMEYVDGQTLRTALGDGRLSAPEALRILDGVAAGLDAIHAQGIVHRDVKPANILLGAKGEVKLADLGIASAPDRTRITAEGIILGTLGYVAPEQIEGHRATPATDVYALAVVAFEALSGRKARSESNAVALAHAVVTRPAPDLRDAWPAAPAAAADLLIRAMSTDPAQRPTSATELTRGLRSAIETPTTVPLRAHAAPAKPATRPQRPTPRSDPGPAAIAKVNGGATSTGLNQAEAKQPHRQQPRPPGQPRTAPPTQGAARQAAAREAAARQERRRRGPAVALMLGILAVAVIAAVLAVQGAGGGSATGGQAHSHRVVTSRGHAKPKPAAKPSSGSGSASQSSAAATPASQSGATANPGATPVTAPAGTPASDSPVAAAERFYTLAASHQYARAWALADPTFRNQLGGYASFVNGQALDRSITFDSAQVTSQTQDSAVLEVRTTSVRANGTQHCAGSIQLQREGSAWLLHLIGINCT